MPQKGDLRGKNIRCDWCGGEFYRQPKGLHWKVRFCSKKCQMDFQGPAKVVELICTECKCTFTRKSSQSRYSRAFCSSVCYQSWRSRHPLLKGVHMPEERKRRLSDAAKDRLKRRPELLEILLQSSAKQRLRNGPNRLEQQVANGFPNLRFVGDGTLWITTNLGKKNPDFKVKGQRAFVEVWGNYWHRGEDPEMLVDAYKEKGFTCLVVWESELKSGAGMEKIQQFTSNK